MQALLFLLHVAAATVKMASDAIVRVL